MHPLSASRMPTGGRTAHEDTLLRRLPMQPLSGHQAPRTPGQGRGRGHLCQEALLQPPAVLDEQLAPLSPVQKVPHPLLVEGGHVTPWPLWSGAASGREVARAQATGPGTQVLADRWKQHKGDRKTAWRSRNDLHAGGSTDQGRVVGLQQRGRAHICTYEVPGSSPRAPHAGGKLHEP